MISMIHVLVKVHHLVKDLGATKHVMICLGKFTSETEADSDMSYEICVYFQELFWPHSYYEQEGVQIYQWAARSLWRES